MKIKQYIREIGREISEHLWEEELDELEFYKEQEEKKLKEKALENYYNNKYKKISIFRNKKIFNKTYRLDVRLFVGNYHNEYLPVFKGEDDEIALKALLWELKNITYVYDSKQFGINEYWAMSYETYKNKHGDCEDFAILLYDILRKNGIPAWRLRIAVGLAVNPFNHEVCGHAYLLYYSIKESKWVSLDGTFFPTAESIKDRPRYKDIGYYGDLWFSFNEEYSWGKEKW